MGPHIFVWFVCVSLLDSLFQVRRHLSINVKLVLLLQLSHQKAVGIQSFLCTTASRSQSGGRDWCVESNYELHCLHGCDLHMLHWDLDYVFRPWMHVAAGSSMLVRLLCRLNKDWPPTTCCISDSSLTGFSFGVGLQQHRFSSGSVGPHPTSPQGDFCLQYWEDEPGYKTYPFHSRWASLLAQAKYCSVTPRT